MKISRVEKISRTEFVDRFLLANTPVIVTDGMRDWDIGKFQPGYLGRTFGDQQVQIYDDLFELQTIDNLQNYLEGNFDRQDGAGGKSLYVRWYTRFKEVDFFWADEVFQKLSSFWSHPYFLPNDNMLIPYTLDGGKANVNEAHYPFKGLFISCRGARTRLHKDPFNSNAILCQFYGEKKLVLYPPQQEPYLMNGLEFVDIHNPDLRMFPQFAKALPTYTDILSPGEILLFPSGWFHDVTCLGDSVSITWNFVHALEREKLYRFMGQYPQDNHMETVDFFLKKRKF
jgi:Cupin-like domain